MSRVLREWVLPSARDANPKVKLSLALPARYEEARAWGYDISAQMQVVHRFIVERPSREVGPPDGSASLSPASRYAFFRWLDEVAGRKASAALMSEDLSDGHLTGAIEEMALAGASEVILSYRPDSFAAFDALNTLRTNVEYLAEAGGKTPQRGVAVYRPVSGGVAGMPDQTEALRFLGLPLRPTPRFPSSSKAAFYTDAALADGDLARKLDAFLQSGGVAYASASVLDSLPPPGRWEERSAQWGVWQRTLDLAKMREMMDDASLIEDLKRMRRVLLAPLGVSLDSPPGVTLSLFGFTDAVLHNYNDVPAPVSLSFPGKPLRIAASSDDALEAGASSGEAMVLPPHSWIHLRV
jgi:hypothetical protein